MCCLFWFVVIRKHLLHMGLGDLYSTGLLGSHPLGLANCVNMSESGEWTDTAPLSLVAGFLETG